MDLQTLTYIVVGFTFALYIGIAIYCRAGSTGEFYVAGTGVHPVANGMATAADWMSAASFISMAGLIAFLGYDASVYLMGWTGGYVLLALLLAPYLRKFGKFTVPEFIGDRYYSKAARLVAVICLIVASITYVIGQMKGVGVAFGRFLEVDYDIGVYVGMSIVFIYAVLGGMMADGSGLSMLDKLDQTVTDLGFAAFTEQKGTTLNIFLLTASLMIGTAGLPHVIVRFFTVPKVSDARTSAGWALVFIAILYTTAPAVGGMARLNLMETIQTGEVGDPSGNLAYEERPQWFRNWEATGLLEFEDKNGDGRIQYYNDANPDFAATATAAGWEGNEMVKVDRDIMVLANPEIAELPNWVIALVAAGGLAAALSTAAGLLLAISSAISHDLLKGMIAPQISEKQELMASRIAMAGAIGVAGYLGLNPPGFAAQTVAMAFGLAASSLFPALMMGIFSKRVNRAGAIAGMLTGLLSTLLYIFWFKGWFFIPGTEMMANTPDNWFLGISPEAFGAVGALLNFSVALLVSRVSDAPPVEIQNLVEDIRVPRGAAAAVDH
jgi:cation/acetate symporter